MQMVAWGGGGGGGGGGAAARPTHGVWHVACAAPAVGRDGAISKPWHERVLEQSRLAARLLNELAEA